MNGRELVMLADMVAKEKGLENNVVLSALEEGFSTSIRKNFPQGVEIAVNIDPQKNSITAWRVWNIKASKAEITDYETDILMNEVEAERAEGDEVQDNIFYQKIDFQLTRQQFNITKQVALQKLRTEIKEQVLDKIDYEADTLLSGSVKLMKKDSIVLDINSLDVIVPRASLLRSDRYKINDKVYFVVDKVVRNAHSTTIYGGRRSEKFLRALLVAEIPAVAEGEVEIVKISRIPGHSAKVVVKSHNPNTDAIRACLGPKAQNVKNINLFMQKEFIDFIRWDDRPAQFLINCMQPVQPVKISIDEDSRVVDVVINDADAMWVNKDTYMQHLKALVDWEVRFFNNENWEKKESEQNSRAASLFVNALDVDEEMAQELVSMGFATIEEVAYTPSAEFEEVLDEETVTELKARAIDYLNNSALNYALFNAGLSFREIAKLTELHSLQDLADMDSYELQENLPDISLEKAGNIILKARELTAQ